MGRSQGRSTVDAWVQPGAQAGRGVRGRADHRFVSLILTRLLLDALTGGRSCAAIYASDLSRAHTTAKKVYEANKTTPKPPFTVRLSSRLSYSETLTASSTGLSVAP